jgi:hypothetical protein
MNALQQRGYDFSDESQLGYDFSDDDNVESESDYEIQTSLEYGRKRRKNVRFLLKVKVQEYFKLVARLVVQKSKKKTRKAGEQ